MHSISSVAGQLAPPARPAVPDRSCCPTRPPIVAPLQQYDQMIGKPAAAPKEAAEPAAEPAKPAGPAFSLPKFSAPSFEAPKLELPKVGRIA